MEQLRDKVYDWSLSLIQEGKIFEGLFLMLSTWNFAAFRYHMKSFDLAGFEREFKKCNFTFFGKKRFGNTDFSDQDLCREIMDLYNRLKGFKGIGPVGATKIMHFMCPHFFVMWDKKIRDGYKFRTSDKDYLEFMRLMQEKYLGGEFDELQSGVSIPRAIDIYNMNQFTNNITA